MAIREYIGARYVPKFVGTYDVTQIYEALDVVDNGLGTSYIAKIPTPAGTPLTDTTHWAIYGASSGAVINLQNQIDLLRTDVNVLQAIAHKRFILIGDSYANGHQATPADGWFQIFKNSFNLVAGQVYSAGEGGYGFIGNDVTKTFLNAIISLESAVTDPDTITDIVVCGGYNDFGKAVSDIQSAISSFITYCDVHYPNAIIHIGMIGYNAQQLDSVRRYIPQTIKAYYAGNYGTRVQILNDVEYALRGAYGFMHSDTIHPSVSGYHALGKAIVSAFLGGSGFCEDKTLPGEAANTVDLVDRHRGFYEVLYKHEIALTFGADIDRFNFQAGTSPVVSNQWVKIGNLENSIAKGVSDGTSNLDRYARHMEFICYDYNNWPNGHYKSMHGLLGIMDTAVYVKMLDIDPDTGVFYDLSGITRLSPIGTAVFNLLEV